MVAGVYVKYGRVLLARRPPGSHLEGAWELPGGKVEAGETPAETLRREWHEELGAIPARLTPWRFEWHRERGLWVTLLAIRVGTLRGTPRPLHATALTWASASDLRELGLAPADRRLLAGMLPE